MNTVEIDSTGQGSVTVPVTYNNIYRGWGEITFTLRDGEEYTANTDSSKRIVRVTIEEVEESSRKISVSAPDRVVEGDDFEITLETTESLASGESIAVELMVVANPIGFYDADNSDQSPISMTNASDSEKFTISTNDSTTLNSNGIIDISVIRGDQYEPASTTAETITIVAKETLPTVSFVPPDPSSIDEGEDAVFMVTATGVTLTQELNVDVVVEQGATDNFIDTAVTTPTIVIVKTSGTGELRVKTKADSVDEPNGTITASLQQGSSATYLLGSQTTESITVRDNDDDGTLPVITISGTTPIYEGDDATFTLQANPAPSGDDIITARVKITETGNFLTTSAKTTPRVQDVVINNTGGKLILPTTSDIEDEADAKIVGRIISEDTSSGSTPTYSIGEVPFFEITIKDNDDPTLHRINIEAVSSPVEEDTGAMARFRITATGGTSGDNNPVAVDVAISQEGNFLAVAPSTRTNIMVNPGAQGVVGTPEIHPEAIEDDDINEPNGAIIAKIVSTSRYAVGTSNVARVRINDDEEVPTLSITPISKVEGQSGTTDYDFAVSLNRATTEVVKVDFEVGKEGDTATLDDDYSVQNNGRTLTFPKNSTDPQYINIDVVGDTLYETNEEFTITLSLPAGMTAAELPDNPTWTGTIRNDDDKPTVTIADNSGDEGTAADGYVEFTVTLSAAAGVPVKVNYTTSDGTAKTPGTSEDDYIPVTSDAKGLVTFNPSNNSGTSNTEAKFRITTKADTTPEADETFEVALSFPTDANATAGSKTTATGIIVSDDDPVLNIVNTNTDGEVEEGGAATFEVTLAGATTGDVTVQWDTANGSAVKGDDFTAGTGILTLNSNNKSKPITVVTLNDAFDEVDQENFVVRLSSQNPTSVGYLNQQASVNVNDNDVQPELSFGTLPTITESNSSQTVRIPVSLNNPSNRVVTVDFAVSGISATLTNDYTVITTPTRLTFNAQDQEEFIEVRIVGDIYFEDNETFSIALSNATNASIATTASNGKTIAINNDDSAPVISISNVYVTEGVDSTGEFVVTQTPGSGKTVSVTLTVADITASMGASDDYEITLTGFSGNSTVLEFTKSDTPSAFVSKQIPFTIRNDTSPEITETFTISLSNQIHLAMRP